MPDGYTAAGYAYRTTIEVSDFNDGDLHLLSKCDTCGALVTGHQSQTKHDAFHEALATLFNEHSELVLWAQQQPRLAPPS